jgi:dienelactone hydrolase
MVHGKVVQIASWILAFIMHASCPLHAADNAPKTQPDIKKQPKTESVNYVTLPKPTGHYTVGTKAIHAEDVNRTQIGASEIRHWMIQAFFPTDTPKNPSPFRKRGTYPYGPSMLQAGAVLDRYVEAYASPYTSVKRNWQAAFPVIIIVPALGQCRHHYTILSEELASHGFMVLVMDFPYISSLVRFNDGSAAVPATKTLWKFKNDPVYRQELRTQALKELARDTEWLLTHLKPISQFLQCTFDPERIVVLGHADGSDAIHTLALKDKRISGVIAYHPEGAWSAPSDTPTAKPLLLIQTQNSKPKSANDRNFAELTFDAPQDLSQQTPAWFTATIWTAPGQKNALTDVAYLAYYIPQMKINTALTAFVNWLLRLNPYDDTSAIGYDAKNPEDWVAMYRSHILEWLQQNHFVV